MLGRDTGLKQGSGIDLTSITAYWLVMSLMALLTFQWIKLVNLGGFALKLPYAIFLVMMAAVAVLPRLRWAWLRLAEECGPWLICFLLYLLIIMPGFHGTFAQGSPIRQVFFALGAMSAGACVLVLQNPQRAFRHAGLLSIFAFLVVTEFIAQQIGTSWVDAVTRFLSGDLRFVIYSFLRAIYRGVGEDEDNETLLASEKNAISAALFMAFVLYRIAGPARRSDWLGVILTPLLGFILLMLNTRSVLLPFVLGLLIVWAMKALHNRRPAATRRILAVFGAVAVLAALMMLAPDSNPFLQMLESRFSLGDSSSASRVNQYSWALNQIDNAILTGNGYVELDNQPVHNLFIASLLHGGLFAFLLTSSFYLIVFAAWLRFVFRAATAPAFWVLPLRLEWVVVLPMLPLIRVWLVGDSGHPALSEWVALAVFFALRLRNRLAAQAAVKPADLRHDPQLGKELDGAVPPFFAHQA